MLLVAAGQPAGQRSAAPPRLPATGRPNPGPNVIASSKPPTRQRRNKASIPVRTGSGEHQPIWWLSWPALVSASMRPGACGGTKSTWLKVGCVCPRHEERDLGPLAQPARLADSPPGPTRRHRGTEGLRHFLSSPPEYTELLWDQSNSVKAVRAALDASNLGWAIPHTFRRTVATLLDQANLPVARIADQLGHADVSLTARVYLGRDLKGDKSELADVLLIEPGQRWLRS